MILPSNYAENMTVDDAVKGYLADGETPENAELLAHVLLTPPPDGLPVL